jgi:hypothetical protein
MKRFKTREQRDRYFRQLDQRTDSEARRHRRLREWDQRRIQAGPLSELYQRNPLASPPDAPQAEC